MFLILRETVSSKLSSSTLLKVEYRTDTVSEEKTEKSASGSFDVRGTVESPRNSQPVRAPPGEVERVPMVSTAETSILPLDSFVCRYVAPLLQCYSPSLRRCVLLKNRAFKPEAVTVSPCSRTVIDVCFPFQKFCEV